MSEGNIEIIENKPKLNNWVKIILIIGLVLSYICLLKYTFSPVEGEKHSFEKPLMSHNCDKTVHSYKPNFATGEGWQIGCVKELNNQKEEASVSYGETIVNSHDKYIQVSRVVPNYLLKHVIVHEWTHAYVYDHSLRRKQAWNNWVSFLHKNNLNTTVDYWDDAEELLADNVARCYLGEGNYNVSGFATIKCSDVYHYFPMFKKK